MKFKRFRKLLAGTPCHIEHWWDVENETSVVTIRVGLLSATGIARCSVLDVPNPDIGLSIAMGRAQRKLYELSRELGFTVPMPAQPGEESK